jgi:hypothetical protein
MLTLLTDIIEKYENNVISSAEIIKHLLEISDEIKKLDEESKELGLSSDEVVFYDTLASDPDLKSTGIDIKEFVKDLGLDSEEWFEYKKYAQKIYSNFMEFETIWEYFLVINKNGFNSDVFYNYYEKLQLAKEFSDLPLNKNVNGAGEGISLAIAAKMSNSTIQKDIELYNVMKRKILCISRHTPKAMWPSFML